MLWGVIRYTCSSRKRNDSERKNGKRTDHRRPQRNLSVLGQLSMLMVTVVNKCTQVPKFLKLYLKWVNLLNFIVLQYSLGGR